MSDSSAEVQPTGATAGRPRLRLPHTPAVIRTTGANLRQAFANDGIRRLGLTWMLGIAADAALTVVTIVTVFNRGGFVAAGVLGAVRMIPAVAAGLLSGTLIERFRGDRFLVAIGLIRAASAAGIAWTIFSAGPTMADHQGTMIALFIFSTIAATAAAPVRPTQTTLMPAIARSPQELVAANTVWSTGEGIGAFVGPFVAAVLMGLNQHGLVAGLAAVTFLVTAFVSAGLRFEHAADAAGGAARRAGRGLRLGDGIRAIRSQTVLAWSMVGTWGQVVTRGLLSAMTVVAAIELLRMGQGGTGLLAAAFGLGGLLGAFFAMTSVRSDRLIRTQVVGLVFWGLPLTVIGLVPISEVALAAMVTIGVSNATYDVALFTTFQRATANEDRAPVLSVLEGVIGVGAISGSLLAPLLLWIFGPRLAMVVGGAILPVMALLIYLRIGRVDRIIVVDDEAVGLLRRVPMFAELPLTAVERLAAGLRPVTFAAGTPLMTQGEPGDEFIVIASGEVEVSVDGRPIHRLGEGSGVGEIALVRRSPRTATVVATTDVAGYAIDASTFLAAIAGPAAAAVTERLADANLNRAGKVAAA
ncbi:MAG: MFS transporter [Chloroflexota bacterium]